MPIIPPPESLLDQPTMNLMDLYGRMRSLTDRTGFRGTLPAIWQCSDETQSIKKALFGYVFNCPTFNLGRVGALLDPTRLATAAHHGRDLVILGGSHIGAEESDGVGYIQRVHGQVAPCCGMLRRMLDPYLQSYRQASQLIRISRHAGHLAIEIPYKYLFRKPTDAKPRIQIRRQHLVAGESFAEGTLGKRYRLHPNFSTRAPERLARLGDAPEPLGSLLLPEDFWFAKQLDHTRQDPQSLLECSVFDFLPEIVAGPRPHRRLCNVNTWRQFHRIAAYITDSFDGSQRNILVIAGLTVDHSLRHNSFVPQFGFWMDQGRALAARYYGPAEIYDLLAQQPVYRPPVTFLEYAGMS